MVRGEGPYLVDADGNRYVDLVCSWGALILGHAHPEVVEAVQRAAERGTSFGTPTKDEVALAEEISARVEPVEQVRLVNSGTEATMSAVRLARGYTGRSKIVKFAGCYHGHVDPLLATAGSGVTTFGLPGSPGVTEATAGDTIVLPYNDFSAAETAFTAYGDEIACVIVEAAAANMGVVPPRNGFNLGLQALCERYGALFILDEVMTGFRVSPSGWYGLEGVAPDLATYAKIVGGGLPAGAFGGRGDIMGALAPVGAVYQAGTLAGNPLATAAGLATLRAAGAEIYRHVDETAQTVGNLASEALTKEGVAHRVQHAGNLFSVFFTGEGVANYESARQQNTRRYAAFFHAMLERGVNLPPSAYEAWFVSSAHDEAAVEKIADALPHAARAAARAG